jgi:hypothetical protein
MESGYKSQRFLASNISNKLTDNALPPTRFIKLAANANMQALMTPATMVHF